MPDTNQKYTSENVETGSVFDILVGNLLAYRAKEWGWSEQDYTKISEEFADAASNDLYYLPAGNYKVSNFPVSLLPTELNIQSTEFVNLQVIANSTSAKTYWLNILNKTYYASIPNAGLSSITWNDASDIGKGSDVTTIHVSNTAPTISDNGSHIWVDTSNVSTNGYASMKQWDNTTSTWKDFVIPGMMDKSVYDPTGKNTDPFIYVMDKLEEVAGDYAQFIRHKNNELTLIHVTSEEKDIYNNDLLTLDQISQMFGTGGSIYEEMINFIESETAEQFGTEDFSAQLTEIEDALNEHITNHIDDTKITYWDNKANADHTHNLDNRVTITGNDIKDILGIENGSIPNAQSWQSVCYGNGKYVATAYGTTMAYSTDGISWNIGNMPSEQQWCSVCYGNGKFVAISYANNKYAYSTDGINWTGGSMPRDHYWCSVCYGNGKYVAVANNSNTMAYSTDGISWTKGTMPSSQEWKSVYYGNGKYVAVAGNTNIMAYSTDGISWTEGNMPSSQYWWSVCYGNGKYVAIAYKSDIMAYSTDGISWTEGNMPNNEDWYSVCYGNGKFVAVAESTNIMAYSTDGISWTQGTMPSSQSWYSVCYGNDKYVTVGYGSNISAVITFRGFPLSQVSTEAKERIYQLTSLDELENPISETDLADKYHNGNTLYIENADGSTEWWKIIDNTKLGKEASIEGQKGINVPANKQWHSVCYGNGKFVAVADPSDIMAYSTDGINWTQGNMPSNRYWNSVCYGNGKYVAVNGGPGDINTMAYSTDGISWTQGNLPGSKPWLSVCYGNGKFVAVANTSNIMAYSTDGINWAEGNMPIEEDWYSVCYGNDKFVAVSYDNNIMAYSTDGISWTLGNMPSNQRWSSVCYGNGKYVAVAGSINSSIFAYSTDGISWTEGTMPSNQSWQEVCYGNDKFVAVSFTGKMAYSTDGINWSESTMPDKNWYSVCYGNGKYVAVGTNTDFSYAFTISDFRDGLRLFSTTLSSMDFSNILNKPDTLSGYGITDGVLSSDLDEYRTKIEALQNLEFVPEGYDVASVGSNDLYLAVQKRVDSSTEMSIDSSLFDIVLNDPGQETVSKFAMLNDEKKSGIKNLSLVNHIVHNLWSCIYYADGKYIIVARESNIMAYSTDGISWTEGNMPVIQNWRSVCYGNDKFVAIGGDSTTIMAYSTDGISWTEGNMPSYQDWRSVCYGNGKYVAVANNSNTMAYSTDGISWTEGNMPSREYWGSVCYGNGKFVAIASSTTNMAYSTDGINWTQGNMPISTYWESVCYGNGKYVAVANSTSNMAYSTDGISWTEGNMPSSHQWVDVRYGNDKYVAISTGNTITMAYSTDGISWTEGTMPNLNNLSGLCYGNGKFVAIRNTNTIILYIPAQIGDTYLNTEDEFVPFSKFPSFNATSKYFTTEYSTDSANPNWSSQGIGRVIKIDKTQNNTVLDNVTIITYGSLNVILNVKWDTAKGLVFSFSIQSAVTSLNSIYEGLNTSADTVNTYLEDALTLINSLVS